MIAQFKEFVGDNWNHPSVVLWDASNETFGRTLDEGDPGGPRPGPLRIAPGKTATTVRKGPTILTRTIPIFSSARRSRLCSRWSRWKRAADGRSRSARR